MFYYRRVIGLEDRDIPNRENIEAQINKHSPIGNELVDAVTRGGSVDTDRIRDLLRDLEPAAFLSGFAGMLITLLNLHSLGNGEG